MRYKELLLEAYIVNSDRIDGFLDYFTQNVDSLYAKQFFNKTLRRQIFRGELSGFLHEIEDFRISGWGKNAEEAKEKGEQIYEFTLGDGFLLDQIHHIHHWIQTLEKDLESEDRNIQIRAERTLKSLPKMKFSDAVKASNDYFKVGKKQLTKKSGLDGREIVFKTDNYIWVKLIEQKAFEDEGKFLQNCIGRIYKANDSNNTIYIMKDRKTLDSHVGMRMFNNNIETLYDRQPLHEIVEIQGKNNCQPKEEYKEPTRKFIEYLLDNDEDKEIGISDYASRAIGIEGIHNGKVYTDLSEYTNAYMQDLDVNIAVKQHRYKLTKLNEIINSKVARETLSSESREKLFKIELRSFLYFELQRDKSYNYYMRPKWKEEKYYKIDFNKLFIQLIIDNYFSKENVEEFKDYMLKFFKKVKKIWQKDPDIEMRRLFTLASHFKDDFQDLYDYFQNNLSPYIKRQYKELERKGREINNLPPEERKDAISAYGEEVKKFVNNNLASR